MVKLQVGGLKMLSVIRHNPTINNIHDIEPFRQLVSWQHNRQSEELRDTLCS